MRTSGSAIPLCFVQVEAEAASVPLGAAGDAMVGTRSWFGGFLYGIGNKQQGRGEKMLDYTFNPLQETRFQKLKERLKVPFDECRRDHQESDQGNGKTWDGKGQIRQLISGLTYLSHHQWRAFMMRGVFNSKLR
ncbi:hypothetical protein OPV22_030617 [Ensete ventricosum]|uniref:Uncharacterized protein n=1 Tax=Ensete ventricosum TaxID=4639 RepID=A0AAV8QGD0_ENSVE|nr:hypothetical protein OPV22_030617 [Ensete ventricosum]